MQSGSNYSTCMYVSKEERENDPIFDVYFLFVANKLLASRIPTKLRLLVKHFHTKKSSLCLFTRFRYP